MSLQARPGYAWEKTEVKRPAYGPPMATKFTDVDTEDLANLRGGRYLQILCGPCNRRKGAGLTVR
jgi:hypothetical protein